jgi:uncharacterized protein YjbI with pentapeptide repeats
MIVLLYVLGCLALAICLVGAIRAWYKNKSLIRPDFLLLLSSTVSVAVFTLITAWLLPEHDSSKSDDLRTAGLAAAAVLALYGLWLNDRRRRTEEERSGTERQRLGQERERTAGEQFASAIELLGNADEAVKVGGMHSLASLARGWPDLVQPVLDVLCAYLCMPADPDNARLQQVRRTAQRIIRETLRAADGAGSYDLDLAGAVIDAFELTAVAVGKVDLTGAHCHGATELSELTATELKLTRALFTGAVTANNSHIDTLTMTGARFEGKVSLTDTRIKRSEAYRLTCKQSVHAERLNCHESLTWQMQSDGPVDFSDAWFNKGLRLRGSTCRGRLGLLAAYLGEGSDLNDVTLADADLRVREPSDLDPQRLNTTAGRDQIELPPWLELIYPPSGNQGRIQRRRDNHVAVR